MDDAALMKTLGLDKKLTDAKKALDDLAKLPEGSEGRKYAEQRIENMFELHVYPDDFKYIAESAERKNNPKSGKEEACCCEPCCF